MPATKSCGVTQSLHSLQMEGSSVADRQRAIGPSRATRNATGARPHSHAWCRHDVCTEHTLTSVRNDMCFEDSDVQHRQ
jgi:hypothetical protein